MTVVNNDAVSDRRLRRHQKSDLPAGLYRKRRIVIDESLELVGSHAAAAALVDIHVHECLAAGDDTSLLVAVGQEQMFGRESPVEERAVETLVYHFEPRYAPFGYLGALGRGDQTVLRIVINEDFDAVADLHVERDETIGEQHLRLLVVFEIKAVIRYARDDKRLYSTNFHIVMFNFAKIIKLFG